MTHGAIPSTLIWRQTTAAMSIMVLAMCVGSATAVEPAFPEPPTFRVTLDARADQIRDIIERALEAGVRVNTALRELYPELPPAALKAVP